MYVCFLVADKQALTMMHTVVGPSAVIAPKKNSKKKTGSQEGLFSQMHNIGMSVNDDKRLLLLEEYRQKRLP
jgi:hypothetical protein